MGNMEYVFVVVEAAKGGAWVFAIMGLGSLLRAGAAWLRYNSTINIHKRGS